LVECLAATLENAVRFNPDDAVRPAVVLWTDHDGQWQPLIPVLRRLLPQLLTLGEYRPDDRTGPAIWLRCVVDGTLSPAKPSQGKIPIAYLPRISRQSLRADRECPAALMPLVELQYRGTC